MRSVTSYPCILTPVTFSPCILTSVSYRAFSSSSPFLSSNLIINSTPSCIIFNRNYIVVLKLGALQKIHPNKLPDSYLERNSHNDFNDALQALEFDFEHFDSSLFVGDLQLALNRLDTYLITNYNLTFYHYFESDEIVDGFYDYNVSNPDQLDKIKGKRGFIKVFSHVFNQGFIKSLIELSWSDVRQRDEDIFFALFLFNLLNIYILKYKARLWLPHVGTGEFILSIEIVLVIECSMDTSYEGMGWGVQGDNMEPVSDVKQGYKQCNYNAHLALRSKGYSCLGTIRSGCLVNNFANNFVAKLSNRAFSSSSPLFDNSLHSSLLINSTPSDIIFNKNNTAVLKLSPLGNIYPNKLPDHYLECLESNNPANLKDIFLAFELQFEEFGFGKFVSDLKDVLCLSIDFNKGYRLTFYPYLESNLIWEDLYDYNGSNTDQLNLQLLRENVVLWRFIHLSLTMK